MKFEINSRLTMDDIQVCGDSATVLEKIALIRYKEYITGRSAGFDRSAKINCFEWCETVEEKISDGFWRNLESQLRSLGGNQSIEVPEIIVKQWRREFPDFFKEKLLIKLELISKGTYRARVGNESYLINLVKDDN